MIKITVKENGKILEDVGLSPGNYLIQIFPEKCKSIPEWRKQMFAHIDSYCQATGNDRYSTWEVFKKDHEIESTKSIKLEFFPGLVENLKYYLMSRM